MNKSCVVNKSCLFLKKRKEMRKKDFIFFKKPEKREVIEFFFFMKFDLMSRGLEVGICDVDLKRNDEICICIYTYVCLHSYISRYFLQILLLCTISYSMMDKMSV